MNSLPPLRPFFTAVLLAALLGRADAQISGQPIFQTTSSLTAGRYHHAATLLPDGKVLVTGGYNGGQLATVEVYSPTTGTWSTTGSMAETRFVHTTTLLTNGLVLVVGGFGNGGYLASAEVYNPVTGLWTPTASLNSPRYDHTATLLPNGKVLVAGGNGPGWLSTTELYDPVAGTWTTTGSLTTARVESTATLLTNGLVLLVGGRDSSGNSLASAELYNPTNGTWTATGNLNAIRAGHTMSVLPSGLVLVTGGYANFASQTYLSTADIYNPATGIWSTTGSLNTARQYATATKLPSGLVLVAGGNSGTQLAGAELFSPSTGTWTNSSSLQGGRYFHTATLLNDGRALLVGGQLTSGTALSTAELFTEPPGIAMQPTNVIANVSSSASFSVTTTGSGPLAFQWLKDGLNVSDATNATLTLNTLQTNQVGGYSVVITNAAGSVTSSVAVLTVNRLVQTITFGPLVGKRVDDASFALTGTASSGLPVSFSSSIPSVATVSGNTVTITGVGSTTITANQPGNATYLSAGSVSQTLVVAAVPPSITTAPVGQSFTLGGGLTLAVNAGGTGPLFYQWQFNGTNLAGATDSTLTLANLAATNAGAYRVVITNAVGTVTSVPVDLYFFGDLRFIAATVLAGSVGQQYRVDYADVVNVGTTNWQVLTNITLPSSPYLVIDPNSPGHPQRYYRATPLPSP